MNRKYIPLLFLIIIYAITSLPARSEHLRKELVWYKNKKCYKDLSEVKEDTKNGILLKVPDFFKDIPIVNISVGEIDPDNAEYYWAAKPETLGLMLTVAKEFKLRTGNRRNELNISGLLRTLEYQNKLCQYNNWADMGRSTHTNGASVDITIHPTIIKDNEQVEILRKILKELHKKEEVFFIDEIGNSCFHVCINPLYEQKYKDIFYNISKDYEIASIYRKNDIFKSFKNKYALEEGIKEGTLLNINTISKKFPLEIQIQSARGDLYSSLKPETAGFIYEIASNLKSSGQKHLILHFTKLIETEEDEKKITDNDPILPENSPFIYGAAFQIDTKNLNEDEKTSLINCLTDFKSKGHIEFLQRDNTKYDIIIKPEKLTEYEIIYRDKLTGKDFKLPSGILLALLCSIFIFISGFTCGFIFSRLKLNKILKKINRFSKKKIIKRRKIPI